MKLVRGRPVTSAVKLVRVRPVTSAVKFERGRPITSVMELSDIAATLDEGIAAWLKRHADVCGAPPPDATATSTLLLATRVAGEVTRACELWRLSVRVTPHAAPGWCVMQVSGPLSPVLALAEVAEALRAFGARSAGMPVR